MYEGKNKDKVFLRWQTLNEWKKIDKLRKFEQLTKGIYTKLFMGSLIFLMMPFVPGHRYHKSPYRHYFVLRLIYDGIAF